jgi:hypothetical protein
MDPQPRQPTLHYTIESYKMSQQQRESHPSREASKDRKEGFLSLSHKIDPKTRHNRLDLEHSIRNI